MNESKKMEGGMSPANRAILAAALVLLLAAIGYAIWRDSAGTAPAAAPEAASPVRPGRLLAIHQLLQHHAK